MGSVVVAGERQGRGEDGVVAGGVTWKSAVSACPGELTLSTTSGLSVLGSGGTTAGPKVATFAWPGFETPSVPESTARPIDPLRRPAPVGAFDLVTRGVELDDLVPSST